MSGPETEATAAKHPSRWPYAVSGLLAAAVAIGVGHLVAAFVSPSASPVLAIGSTVIDATPTPAKDWAIRTLGTADKPVLVTIVGIVTLLAAAGIGLLSRRWPTPALLLLMGLGVLAMVAAVKRPAAGPFDALPGLVAAIAAAIALTLLVRLLGPDPDGSRHQNAYPSGPLGSASRRNFLYGAAGAGAVAAGSAAIGRRVAAGPALPAAGLPTPAEAAAPLPQGLEKTVRGISAFQTSNADFYRVDTALFVPRVDAKTWKLSIEGEVDEPFTITYDELTAMPMIERDITMTCVSNEVGGGYISSARWLGVRTADLLKRAGVRATADQILSRSVDGFTISTPVKALTDGRDALLAVGMNGKLLPTEHGFPVRMVTPGLYGFVGSTKWVTKMTATTYAKREAYWTERGWATDSPVLTQSRIDTPRGGATIKAGRTFIGGVAWAQHRGISGVQVRVDDGDWAEATLGPDAGIDYWRQWYLPWDATKGRHDLTVRATDRTGAQQTSQEAPPFPKGATGYHSIVVVVD